MLPGHGHNRLNAPNTVANRIETEGFLPMVTRTRSSAPDTLIATDNGIAAKINGYAFLKAVSVNARSSAIKSINSVIPKQAVNHRAVALFESTRIE
jgi:hypothetical protein